jgi:asparagine synthase (glutamine-hydrolysing)
MCGIAAIFNYDPSGTGVDRSSLLRMRESMISRGPDGAGEWFASNHRIGLAHRRLSIIDTSSAGAQPMHDIEKTLVIVFNGEIYNYQALRRRLEEKGCRFRSHSDTEVLLHLYREKGEQMVHELRGMYAFALWDEKRQALFLARDPFGVKPLYYADDGKVLRAASQVKALLAGDNVNTSPDAAGHVGYFLWGHVPEPFTLFEGIRSVPAGASMWVDANGAGAPRVFCSVKRILADAETDVRNNVSAETAGRIREILSDSVRHHLVADVPVGVFLSSGLDSTTVAALAAEANGKLSTVTLGFEEYRGTDRDEVPLAERVACQYGAKHQTIWVREQDFREDAGALMNAMDQPTIDGVNTYFVSKVARQAGLTVALSGLGGDELFAGYPSFKEIPKAVRRLSMFNTMPAVARGFRRVSALFLKRFTSRKYAGLLEYGGRYSGAYLLRRGMFMPWELPGLLDADLVRAGWEKLQPLAQLEETVAGLKSDRLRVAALEMTWYMRHQLLRDTDWAGMAHSVEIRVPFVDATVLRGLAPLLVARHAPGKVEMAQTAAPGLPKEILSRRKTGFSVPIRNWLIATNGIRPQERGLRGWTRYVYDVFTSSRTDTSKGTAWNTKVVSIAEQNSVSVQGLNS